MLPILLGKGAWGHNMKKKDLNKLMDSLLVKPKSKNPAEWIYALMREAESLSAKDKFRAMDCHEAIADLSTESHAASEAFLMLRERIGENQTRLGIL